MNRLVALVLIVAAGCGSVTRKDLMPAPVLYTEAGLDPFKDRPDALLPEYILYATDREPAAGESKEGNFYLDERGHVLRLGHGEITIDVEGMGWDEFKKDSLAESRKHDYDLIVPSVEEFGTLDRSITVLSPEYKARTPVAANAFAQEIADQLQKSGQKDIVVYVHGFKVAFEDPLMIAMSLWHYTGYRGVFIAYSWPSTPSLWAYAKDLETANYAARNLRVFLEYLADNTDARIHILGYSAGTRVVAGALSQIAMLHAGKSKAEIFQKMRIGHAILVGSDIDRDLMGAWLLDGLLNACTDLTIYRSATDGALGISNFLFARKRVGQFSEEDLLRAPLDALLRAQKDLIMIDVTGAAGSASGNGHAYFRKSPWVSSDILLTLILDPKPAERGLIRRGDEPLWRFPEDYPERLKKLLAEAAE
ncbi:MAG: alpha/beta hydrolase [Planctomycetota bacterium]|jgi:esterase/lipase superfamily enzyme